MTRLGWALLLAAVMHVFFFRMTLPDRPLRLPEVRGSGPITVSIVRPAAVAPAVPERPAEKKTAPVRQAQGKEDRATAGRAPERAAPPLRPARTKMEVRREPAAVGGQVAESGGKGETEMRTASPVSAESKSDDSPSAGHGTVRQAAPLTAENRPPDYPVLARRRGWEGTVVLAVRVLENGLVGSIEVRSSSSYGLLDKAALQAVRQWRFQPGTRGGEPAAMEVLVPVHFVLRDQ